VFGNMTRLNTLASYCVTKPLLPHNGSLALPSVRATRSGSEDAQHKTLTMRTTRRRHLTSSGFLRPGTPHPEERVTWGLVNAWSSKFSSLELSLVSLK
jgi:hypothetical protein